MEYVTLLLVVVQLFATIAIFSKVVASEKKDSKEELQEFAKEIRKDTYDIVSKERQETAVLIRELSDKMNSLQLSIVESLSNIKEANYEAIVKMNEDNKASLDKINDTVNEKLQKTLDDRISQSFEAVRTQLTEVYKGLGEMKNLASGVSDLKNVLSNVKTRGIIGEYQLEAILDEILTRDQFEVQFQLVPNSPERVDFAVKLPGMGEDAVYLPIDSKFPGDTYAALVSALESGSREDIDLARKQLRNTILSEAKSIHDKYIEPPYTTDFAIMFLPFEGLYAEVVNMGLLEEMQRKYNVNIAGPSTMAAMLTSFRMGFRTLAIQKRSGEVWKVLEAVKKEFGTFEQGLGKLKERLTQSETELDKLIGTRTTAINRKLKEVSSATTFEEARETLGIPIKQE